MKSNRKKHKRRRQRRAVHCGQWSTATPTQARQLVALWADHQLARAGRAPLHFLTFCHDVQLFTQQPIDWRRAQQAWMSAITLLGTSHKSQKFPSEMSAADAENLVAIEGVGTWAAALQCGLLSAAVTLVAADYTDANPSYFRTSKWTRSTVSLFDEVETTVAAQAEQSDG